MDCGVVLVPRRALRRAQLRCLRGEETKEVVSKQTPGGRRHVTLRTIGSSKELDLETNDLLESGRFRSNQMSGRATTHHITNDAFKQQVNVETIASSCESGRFPRAGAELSRRSALRAALRAAALYVTTKTRVIGIELWAL